jgi:AcrR family transcriptional regulator
MENLTTTVKRGRRRQIQTRCDAILDAARELMAERGYAAMTMDDLAARAGITKPTLYRYFPSKEAIAVQAVVRLMRHGRTHLASLDPDLPAVERIEHVLRWVLRARYVDRHAMFGVDRDTLNPLIRSHPEYQTEAQQVIGLFTHLIEQAKAEGQMPAHLITRVAAQPVFSILRDWEYDELLATGNWTPEELVEALSHIILHGLRQGVASRA